MVNRVGEADNDLTKTGKHQRIKPVSQDKGKANSIILYNSRNNSSKVGIMSWSIDELRILSKDEREPFIKNKFHTSEVILKNIRNGDTRKRLINAIQFLKRNNFPVTHDNVTWLAGFNNNILITKNFGSIYALRSEVDFLPKFYTWNGKVIYSKQDMLKNIIIPNDITPEVAEIAGIHAGDGTQWLHSGICCKESQYFFVCFVCLITSNNLMAYRQLLIIL